MRNEIEIFIMRFWPRNKLISIILSQNIVWATFGSKIWQWVSKWNLNFFTLNEKWNQNFHHEILVQKRIDNYLSSKHSLSQVWVENLTMSFKMKFGFFHVKMRNKNTYLNQILLHEQTMLKVKQKIQQLNLTQLILIHILHGQVRYPSKNEFKSRSIIIKKIS